MCFTINGTCLWSCFSPIELPVMAHTCCYNSIYFGMVFFVIFLGRAHCYCGIVCTMVTQLVLVVLWLHGGIQALWHHGALAPWCPGTMASSWFLAPQVSLHCGTTTRWHHCTLTLWHHDGTLTPWQLWLWHHGSPPLVPRICGTMVPWYHVACGTMVPWHLLLWHCGTMHCILAPFCHPYALGKMVPIVVPQCLVPWCHGATVPWCRASWWQHWSKHYWVHLCVIQDQARDWLVGQHHKISHFSSLETSLKIEWLVMKSSVNLRRICRIRSQFDKQIWQRGLDRMQNGSSGPTKQLITGCFYKVLYYVMAGYLFNTQIGCVTEFAKVICCKGVRNARTQITCWTLNVERWTLNVERWTLNAVVSECWMQLCHLKRFLCF